MTEEGSRRQSRGKELKSYRFEDVYSFLDEDGDGSGASGTQTPLSQDEALDKDDGDDFMPDEEEEAEEQDEDYMEDDLEPEDEDDDDDEEVPIYEHTAKGDTIIEVDFSDGDNETPSTTLVRPKQKRKRRAGVISQMKGFGPGGQVKAPINFIRGAGTKVRTMGIDRLKSGNTIRSRGVVEFGRGGQEARLKELFGPSHTDLMPVLRTRDKWSFQEAFPSRSEGSLSRSFFEGKGARDEDIEKTRGWYESVGREKFVAGQSSRKLEQEEGMIYMAKSESSSINVLLGGVSTRKVFTLKMGSHINIGAPFDEDQNRRGWLFNLGARIQDAQWATNEEGSTQYLAVAVTQELSTSPPLEKPTAPAFTATEPYPGSIQIWAFNSNSDGDLDTSKEPNLELVICADWGAPKSLRWSPIGPKDSVEPADGDDMVRLGLLAATWSDGRVRILDVSFQEADGDSPRTQFLHYSKAAFDVGTENSVASCLHWLSGTTLAVGSSTGMLAVWNLTRPEMFPSQSIPHGIYEPSPSFFKQLADTYIITLSSAYPSRPHFVSVTTADGFGLLYDIRSSAYDTTASVRGRFLCVAQAWHEHTQSFIMPDEHYMLKINTLRRYYHNLYIMRANSTIACCATSPVQPGILLGTVDGTVVSGNPISRVMNSKEMPWQQPWFIHEWRPAVDKLKMKIKPGKDDATNEPANIEDSQSDSANNVEQADNQQQPQRPKPDSVVPQSVLSEPLARITEGYRAHQPGIQYSSSFKKMYDGVKLITIHEERSAITTLAWNPNLKFGTWAVAGMADGLLRVEDIGVE